MQRGDTKTERYENLDGLRVLSCFAIIAMHIQANTGYELSGFFWKDVIHAFTWLVYLFLMISGFGMCNGYLEKFNLGMVDLEAFYKRRYLKMLPFFTVLIMLALFLDPSLENFYEATLEVTLVFGLLPNVEMNVLGVSWTLGVIFLFYMLFPFLSVFLKNRKRTWMLLAVSMWINFSCENYFFSGKFVTASFVPRHSFLYCMQFFVGGALVYHYRKEIKQICEKYQGLLSCGILLVVVLYFYFIKEEIGQRFLVYQNFIVCLCFLIYAVGAKSIFLKNNFMKAFSRYSMEIYLSHMIVFRIVAKAKLIYIFGRGWSSYLLTVIMVIFGTYVFVKLYKQIEEFIVKRFKR